MDLPVIARLRLPDGREFDSHHTIPEQYADVQGFSWREHNNACDCNRSLYLNREYNLDLGELDSEHDVGVQPIFPDEKCLPCGDTIQLVSLTVGGKEV